MIKIKVIEVNKTIEFEADGKKSLLDACLENNIHIDHACGSNAACSTCHIKVEKGMNLLPEVDDIEEDLIDFAEDVSLTSRLSCQCIPEIGTNGDIDISLPEQKGLH